MGGIAGAEIELVHLYDLEFVKAAVAALVVRGKQAKGWLKCCIMKDDMTEVLSG